LRSWYLHSLQPKLARAATTGAVDPQAVAALDAEVTKFPGSLPGADDRYLRGSDHGRRRTHPTAIGGEPMTKVPVQPAAVNLLEDGQAALEWAARYLERVGDLPVLAQIARPGEIRSRLPASPPDRG
jgi:hypothetical protein